jgi:hypothetical protein
MGEHVGWGDTQMVFTPEDMDAVGPRLEGINRNVPVPVEPAADKLLMPNTARTVTDILNLPTWPAEQLRLTLGTLAACRRGEYRADALTAAGGS